MKIYGGTTPPAELLSWAQSLRRLGEKKRPRRKRRPRPRQPPAAPPVKKDKVQAGLAKGAIRAAQDGYPVYSVSSDVRAPPASAPSRRPPGISSRWSIAEANMVSTGAGLNKGGVHPDRGYLRSVQVTKGNLPLTMAALSRGAGDRHVFPRWIPGCRRRASHQATTYLAW